MLFPAGAPVRALVVGGRGGISSALVQLLRDRYLAANDEGLRLVCTSRNLEWVQAQNAKNSEQMKAFKLNVEEEQDFESMTNELLTDYPEFRPNVIINATGLLHDAHSEPPLRPETSIKQLNSTSFRRSFDVNVLGNFLTVRYFLGELADRKALQGIFATLSARVGSINDNSAGGWYSYRCGKAAVNALVKGVSIECQRTHPSWRCAAMHPGTVDTDLSVPFMRAAKRERHPLIGSVREAEECAKAGDYAFLTPEVSAEMMWQVLNTLDESDRNGVLLDYAGREIPF